MARSIAAREGVRSLWSGVAPACVRVGGGAGLYFLCLSTAQRVLSDAWPRAQDGSPAAPALRTFVLGATSRAAAATVFCPITVVKTRMEYGALGGVRYAGTLQALAHIARTEKLRGLFSGLGPTLVRDAPYSGLYLLLFSRLREAGNGETFSGPVGSFTAAALAGGLATCVTHPPDVVRTRLQLRRGLGLAPGVAPAVRLGDIVAREGVAALWSGLAPRLVRRMLQQGMTWTLFEYLFQGRLV